MDIFSYSGFFNAAIPSIESELKALGMWKDNSIIFNMEYVSGQTNVQEYEGNFLAIHGLNKFEQVTPRRRASSEIQKRFACAVKEDCNSAVKNILTG